MPLKWSNGLYKVIFEDLKIKNKEINRVHDELTGKWELRKKAIKLTQYINYLSYWSWLIEISTNY